MSNKKLRVYPLSIRYSDKSSENIYRFDPILRKDAWNRFAGDSVKNFKVKVAVADKGRLYQAMRIRPQRIFQPTISK